MPIRHASYCWCSPSALKTEADPHPLARAEFDRTPEKLDEWLANPGKMLPGSRMTFLVANPQTRADLIAYLKALHDGKTEGLAIPKDGARP